MLQVEVIGNLGGDAEIKDIYGKQYVSMNVAHSERKKDGSESTVWVSALWYGNGGNLMQHLTKGCKVFLRGRLAAKAYLDRSNQPQSSLTVYVTEITLCGSKAANAPAGDDGDMPF